MEKRTRSPNYPAMSLPAAIEKTQALYRNQHTHSAPREVAVKGMGYNSLNGASATAISALHKYGLLERVGDEVKVSERALRIFHPHSPEEKAQAIREAAAEPQLFAELGERFPDVMPNPELLRNYLVRKGFAQTAAESVVNSYRETSEFVEREGRGYDSPPQQAPEAPMQLPAPGHHVLNARDLVHGQATQNQAVGRQIGRYDFEGGSFVQLLAGGEIETEAALDMIETLVQLKRAELKRGTPKGSPPATESREKDGDNDNA